MYRFQDSLSNCGEVQRSQVLARADRWAMPWGALRAVFEATRQLHRACPPVLIAWSADLIWVPSCALLMKLCTLCLGGDIFGLKLVPIPR